MIALENIIIGLILAAVIAWALWRTIRRARRGSACCGEREGPEARVRVADRDRSHYPYEAVMTIGGMTCENCARRVENALNRLEGVWATVSIDSRRAGVRCKTAPSEAALREAVRAAGYVVTEFELK